MKLFSKFSIPTLQFQVSPPPPSKNFTGTLYPSLSRAATARGAAARHSIISTESNNEVEVSSWSSLDDPSPVKEIIPLTAFCDEQEIHRVTLKILQQCIDFLKSLPNDESYVFESNFIPSSTIGKHPLISKRASTIEDEFNNEEYNDYDSVETINESHSWNVDYDNNRDQTSREIAIKQVLKLQSTIISDCTSIPLNTIIDLNATVDVDMSNGALSLQSTYGRELWFCCLHAIHHYALIKVICIEQNISCPRDFGLTPSTIQSIELPGKFIKE
ncbi:22457_t:CDS:2 [Cetraspora pellucida]|uniref:22457_t:CDS:1 n=1 Tax=Cetraspora pellucida TaxID=1433469 RepID=A0A9N8VQY7_9GLOM|nr:22457_t:CDS:2 [Cetraspora pellucida]